MATSSFSGGIRGGSNQQRKWLGGYVRHGKKGPAYIIERWIDGHRYHVSTKCRTERAALVQLAEFEADPRNYKPDRARIQTGNLKRVAMTAELVDEYRAWMTSRTNPASKEHADKHETRLMAWMKFYRDRDVRTVKLQEIAGFISGKKDRPMRIQSLKAFFGWLRKTKYLLDRSEDPTLDLDSEPARASQNSREVYISPENILKVLPHLPDRSRDVIILRLGTGWHGKEVERFCAGGTIRYTPGKSIWLETGAGPREVPLLATLHVKQKTGVETKTPIIYPEHLAAAERIQFRRYVPSQLTMNQHVTKACMAAGVPRFLNWHLRHTVVSYADDQGVNLEHSAKFIDHVGIDTARKHYRQMGLPRQAIPVVRIPELRVINGGVKAG